MSTVTGAFRGALGLRELLPQIVLLTPVLPLAGDHTKVTEKTLPGQLQSRRSWRGVLGIVTLSGAGGIRTPYLLTASQALSQLSYSPEAIIKSSIKPIGIQEEPALDFS